MEVMEAIRRKRAVRNYKPQPLPQGKAGPLPLEPFSINVVEWTLKK